jgi:hypothetical protein
MGILRFVLTWLLGIALSLAVQLWDRSRLSPAQRERAWNLPSWAVALYWFGPLSMLGWARVTRIGVARWWPRRRLYQAGAVVLVLAAGYACAEAIGIVVALLVTWITGAPMGPPGG